MLELAQGELPMLPSEKTSEMPTAMPSGTVTFLFTDIEGSTKLWERYPIATGEALVLHDKLLQSSIKYHGGHVFKSKGDGFCAAFSSAANALEAALDSQYSLHKEKWPEPIEEIKVRMAIHSGTADTREGDYFGPPLNRVARMESTAHGGQIILSQAARHLLGSDLPTDVDLIDLGTYHLRSLQQPEKIYQAASSNLEANFPPLLTKVKGRSNLPSQPTTFIGRNTELEQIIDLIDQPDCRLLTLVGPGGIGKTRLALHVADQRLDYYPHGIYFVPLAPLALSECIIPTIADALNFSFDIHSSDLDPVEQLLDYLRERKALLVMDNFEHLLDSAGLIGDILNQTSEIKLLVTSREKLNLQAEWLFDVKSMRYPRNGAGHNIEEYSAVQLFIERARKADNSFTISEKEKPYLKKICQLVDGTPLGLELAAAWAPMLSCQEIADEIDRNIDFLSTSLQDVPERQRSVRAAFEHSWKLLTEEQRASYRRLMVFKGGFDRQAARALSGVDLLQLVQMVNKSLLWRKEDGRYERHELLAQFASEKLHSNPEEEKSIFDNHSRYFLKYLSDRTPYLGGSAMPEYRQEIRDEMQNINLAVDWAIRQWPDDLGRGSLENLASFYMVQGWHEGMDAFKTATQDLGRIYGTDIESGKEGYLISLTAQVWLANFYSALGRHEESEQISQDILLHLRLLGDSVELAVCLLSLGINANYRGDYELGKKYLEESIAVSSEAGKQDELGTALLWLGWAEYSLGDYKDAQAHFYEANQYYEKAENYWGMAFALSKLGLIADALEDYDSATRYHEEGLNIFIRLGDIAGEGYTLSRLSLTAYGQGNYEDAKRLGLESYEKFAEVGHRWGMMAAKCRTGFGVLGLGDLDEARDYFLDAFDRALVHKMVTSALYALAGMACVLAQKGQEEQAADVFFFVLKNPGTPAVYKALIEPYFAELRESADPGLMDLAEENADQKALEDFASLGLGLKEREKIN
jgi:predicted ATPase/class 3 adenylate cyclase